MDEIRSLSDAHLFAAIANQAFADLGLVSRMFVMEDRRPWGTRIEMYFTSTASFGCQSFFSNRPNDYLGRDRMIELTQAVAKTEINARNPSWSCSSDEAGSFHDKCASAKALIAGRFEALSPKAPGPVFAPPGRVPAREDVFA